MKLKLIITLLLPFISTYIQAANHYLIEAESFVDKGGWVVDNQSMMQMGSPYLMAHGVGRRAFSRHSKYRIVYNDNLINQK